MTLIGATTENPYFEVNQALLSRCTVIELEPLTLEELAQVVGRGAARAGSGALRRRSSPRSPAARAATRGPRSRRSSSRGRRRAAERPLDVELVDDVARKRPLRYDRAGDRHYDLASAFIKSMRGSDPDAAVYYLAAMLEGGEDPRFLARRIVIAASEDVGNADPQALVVAVAAAQALEHVGLPEAQLNLAQAAIYVARAPKSNASARAIWDARADVRRDGIGEPPAALRDAHYRGAAARGHGVRVRLAARRSRAQPASTTCRRACEDVRTMSASGNGEEGGGAAWRSRRVTGRRSSISRRRPASRGSGSPTTSAARTCCSSSTPSRSRPICTEEAQDLQENLASFRNANTEIVFVSCDTSAARQAWKAQLGAEYTFASDFWSHGAAAKRYGVFNEETGAPIRGTFLIDQDGVVIWSLVATPTSVGPRWCPGRSRRSASRRAERQPTDARHDIRHEGATKSAHRGTGSRATVTPGGSRPPGGGADRGAAGARAGCRSAAGRRAAPAGAPRALVSRSALHAPLRWGDEEAPRVVCLHGVTAWGGALRAARRARSGDPPRPRAGPPRARRIALGAAVADRRPPRARSSRRCRRRAAIWLGHSFGARLALEHAAPQPGQGRAARPARPRDRAPAARRALGGRERAAGPRVRELRGGDRPALRGEPAARAPRALVEEELRGHLVGGRATGGATATRRPLSSSAYAELATPAPAFADGRVPTLVVLGEDSYLPYDHTPTRIAPRWATCSRSSTVPGGHTVLWDALDETATAVRALPAEPP